MATQIDTYHEMEAFDGLVAIIPALGDDRYETAKFHVGDVCSWQISNSQSEPLYRQDGVIEYLYGLYSGAVLQERLPQDGNRLRPVLRCERDDRCILSAYDVLFGSRYSVQARAVQSSVVVQVRADAFKRLLNVLPELRSAFFPQQRFARLLTVPLLGSLPSMTVGYLTDFFTEHQYSSGKDESEQNKRLLYDFSALADTLYVIDQGQVKLTWRDNRRQVWLGNGGVFGWVDGVSDRHRMALGVSYNHRAECQLSTKSLAIPRERFFAITGRSPDVDAPNLWQACDEAIRNVPVLRSFSDLERQQLLGLASHYHIRVRHVVLQQGEYGDSTWILMPGHLATMQALPKPRAKDSKADKNNGKSQAGSAQDASASKQKDVEKSAWDTRAVWIKGVNYFNEDALLVQNAADSTIIAEPGSQWLRIHRQDFRYFDREISPGAIAKLAVAPTVKATQQELAKRRRYSWLQDGEVLHAFQRRHWIALLNKCMIALLLAVMLFPLSYLLTRVPWLESFAMWIWGIAGLVTAAALAWGLLDYWNDFIYITNQRVVRQEKVILISEHRQEAPLEQIQNANTARTLLGNLLGYGDLLIQTAGATGAIKFDFVRKPEEIQKQLFRHMEIRKAAFVSQNKTAIQDLLGRKLGRYPVLPARVVFDATEGAGNNHSRWQRLIVWLRPQHHMKRQTGDLIVWRKHWFVLVTKLFVPAALLFLMVLMAAGVELLPGWFPVAGQALEMMAVLFGLILLAYMAWMSADWRNDRYEISASTVEDVEKKPLFFAENRRVAQLDDIQNIELNIPSPVNYLLNFGNVRLQTAATEGDFTFDSVPDPRSVAAEVRRRIEQYRRTQEQNRLEARSRELPDWFDAYRRMETDDPLHADRGLTSQS